MKLFGFFVGFSAAQLPIIGLDNDETISISSLARGRGGRGGKKFGSFYDKLKSGTSKYM